MQQKLNPSWVLTERKYCLWELYKVAAAIEGLEWAPRGLAFKAFGVGSEKSVWTVDSDFTDRPTFAFPVTIYNCLQLRVANYLFIF